MIKDRILSTLKFFDLQDYPVTLLELHQFLLDDLQVLRTRINTSWELIDNNNNDNNKISIDKVLKCMETECQNEVRQKNGFYCLIGRLAIIDQRLSNYFYGIKRERRIRRFARGLKFLPFVRGAALAGSQAMGQQKETSDIDLLIILDPKFLWLGRTLVTAYFQVLGIRRHGKKISNRFCLNHYLAGIKSIMELRNLYTAWEYMKLRSLVYPQTIANFQIQNRDWIAEFFPNFRIQPLYPSAALGTSPLTSSTSLGVTLSIAERVKRGEGLRRHTDEQSSVQSFLERMLSGNFGVWLEAKLKNWQLPKIRREEFILVLDDELSFHPQSKQQELLARFFAL